MDNSTSEDTPLSSITFPDRWRDCRVDEGFSWRAAAILMVKSLHMGTNSKEDAAAEQLEDTSCMLALLCERTLTV